jgi:hypothetical protein
MSAEEIKMSGSMKMPVSKEAYESDKPIFKEGQRIEMKGEMENVGPMHMAFEVLHAVDNHNYKVFFPHSEQYFDLQVVCKDAS